VTRPNVELRVFVCVMKLLSVAGEAEEVETIVEPRESVERMRVSPVRSELELLNRPVGIADPLKVIPSSVTLGIEEFDHPLRPIELVECSWGTKVDVSLSDEVVSDWTAVPSTNPREVFKMFVLGADTDEIEA
jgi:hypothetical protein